MGSGASKRPPAEWEQQREWRPGGRDSGYDSCDSTQKRQPPKGQKVTAVEKASVRGNNLTPQNGRNRESIDVSVTTPQEMKERMKRWKPGKLFVDRDFPIDQQDILAPADRKDGAIKWKRPRDLVSHPRLLVDGLSRGDIAQGSLADCWFLSSCAAIAAYPNLMKKVVVHPERQHLYGSEHTGMVHFRFWRFGKWTDVYVDDRLPVKDSNKLIYARAIDENEFWVPLIEKAYAKLHGSYAALEGGQSMDALVDLTGGLAERYELKTCSNDLYVKLATANTSGAFITCSLEGDWRTSSNTPDEVTGLVSGHAYTVTAVKRIKRVRGFESLLRIRNPWGKGQEWTGAWSDSDDRWNLVDDATKKWLHFTQKDDGEFWMCFKDFKEHFEEVTVCTLGPDFDGDGKADKAGTILTERGSWRIGRSAGGCRNNLQMFSTNPQYLLTVHECDDPTATNPALLPGDTPRTNTCSVVIALMQINRRATGMRQIGFILYQVEQPLDRLGFDHFMYNYETAKSGTYVNIREVCGRFELRPGYYVVIPSTFEPNDDGGFLLRVFAQKSIGLSKLADYDNHDDTISNIIAPRPVESTRYGETGYRNLHANLD